MRTQADYFHGISLHGKPSRQFFLQPHRFQITVIQIHNRLAVKADKMMMGVHIGLQPRRAMMQAHLSQQSAVYQSLDVFMNRRQRYGRNALPDLFVNRFRTGMIVHRH